MKTYIQIIKLRKWFPPGDRLAATVARLCVLREDFALEVQGIHAAHVTKLDANTAAWRRLYFWRNLVRTISEIRQALETLSTIPEFKKLLRAQPDHWQKKFKKMTDQLRVHKLVVSEFRDSLGAHVLQQSVEKALSNMSLDRMGVLEVGRTLKDTHYRFAGELVAEILLAKTPDNQREAALAGQFRTIADLLPVYELTEIVVTMYADARKLIA